jgi:hypothetical protein
MSVSVSRLLASSTVITPSLPTFRIALPISSPMKVSPFAEMVPTWAISSGDVIFLECVSPMIDHVEGEADVAFKVNRPYVAHERGARSWHSTVKHGLIIRQAVTGCGVRSSPRRHLAPGDGRRRAAGAREATIIAERDTMA